MTSRVWLMPLLIFAAGCARSSAEPVKLSARAQAEAAQPPVNVKVEPVRSTEVTERIVVTGETAADAVVTYSAEVSGQVEYLAVDIGQRVRPGQVLARIDYTALRAHADEAAAAHDFARKTFQRLAALKRDDLVPQDKLDQARSNLIAAEARSRIARSNLRKSVITAKRAGVVTRKLVERGEFATPGAPMFEVVDHRTLVVHGQLAENQVPLVRRGSPARVTIDAMGKTLPSRVDVVLPVADPSSKTYEVRLRLPNPGLRISVGMSATIQLEARASRRVVLVPQDVVVEDGACEERAACPRSVFVEAGGQAKRRSVRLGPTHEDRVVVLDGIRTGDRLVVLGQRGLHDGQPVHVVD